MDHRNKIALWAVGVVLLMSAIGVWLYHRYEKDLSFWNGDGTIPLPTATGTPAGLTGTSVGTAVNSPSLSYAHAVNVYAATRIQFDADCRMAPEGPVFKNGATVMFDNRHRDGRYFRLDGTRYWLPGYGFKLLKLAAKKLPHTVAVDCGTGRNTGVIVLN